MVKIKTRLSPIQKVSFGKSYKIILSVCFLGVLSTQYNADKGLVNQADITVSSKKLEVASGNIEAKVGLISDAAQNIEKASAIVDLADAREKTVEETVEETVEKVAETSTLNNRTAKVSQQSKRLSQATQPASIASPNSIVQTSSAVSISQIEMTVSAYTGKLQWTSSYQRNIASFIIEKSTNDEEYEEIGKMAGEGRGEFSMKKSYEFEDTTLMYTQMPRIYYRLKQKGTQGDHDYSEIIEYDLGLSNGIYASISLSPKRELQIQYAGDKSGPINYQILNAFGTPLMGAEIEADFDPQSLNIDAKDWEKGTYYLRLIDEKHSIMQPFFID